MLKQENVKFEKEAVELIARAGEGSVRDTLSIADRCVSYSADNLTLKSVIEVLGTTERESLMNITGALLSGDLGQSLRELDKVLSEGKSPLVLSKDLISYFRDLLVIGTLNDDAKKMVVASEDVYKKMAVQAEEKNYAKILLALNSLSEVEAELRYSINPRLVLETAIIRTLTTVNLEERVEKLENALSDGATIHVKPITTPVKAAEQKLVEQKPVANSGSADQLLGNLLSYLRERKDMSLLSCIRQVKVVRLEGKVAVFVMEDKMTADMASREKYRPLLSEFFGNIGLEYRFVVEAGRNFDESIGALEKAFEGKLKIEE